MSGNDDAAFEELIERSSLGTPGARRLRRRTPPARAAAVRTIGQLQHRMTHPGYPGEGAEAAAHLARLYSDLGYDHRIRDLVAAIRLYTADQAWRPDPETHVFTTPRGLTEAPRRKVQHQLVDFCNSMLHFNGISVENLAIKMALPIGIVQALVADLEAADLLDVDPAHPRRGWGRRGESRT